VENVSLQSSLRTPEDRTHAIGEVIKSLGEMIPGIRNEVLRMDSWIIELFCEMIQLHLLIFQFFVMTS
jgi:hypothetical protein